VFDLLDSGLWAPVRLARGTSRQKSTPRCVDGFEHSTTGIKRPLDDPGLLRCAVNLQELGLPGMHLEAVVEMVASLPFEASMNYLGPVAAGLHHARHDQRLQLRLAEQILGDGPLLHAIQRFVSTSADRLVFDERYLTALQRLLVEHASSDPAELLSEHDRAVVLTSLLAMGDVLPDWSPPEPEQDGGYDVASWATYTVQRGAYYNTPYVLEAIVRNATMLIDIANEPDLASHRAVCPLDDWATDEAGGATLTDQIALGIALAIGSQALDPSKTLADRVKSLSAGYVEHTGLSAQSKDIFRAISADRAELRSMFAKAGRGPEHLAWDHAPFEQRPFLRRSDGALVLISPSALVSWLGRGLYFRILDAANARPHPTSSHRRLGPDFLKFTGVLGERFTFRLIERSHQHAIKTGKVVVSGNQLYHKGNQEILSPDVAVAQPPHLVLFEVFSGRIPRAARVGGTPELVGKALRKMVLEKLDQLQKRTGDILDGRVTIPGVVRGLRLQIWPVIILAGEGVLQTPILWRWIHDQLPDGAFLDERVRPPTIGDLDDLDPLLVLVERGHTLPSLLEDFQSSQHAEFSPRNWVAATQGLFEHERPAYVHSQFENTMREVHGRLFPGSQRFTAPVPVELTPSAA
jgi:hypothetical protein